MLVDLCGSSTSILKVWWLGSESSSFFIREYLGDSAHILLHLGISLVRLWALSAEMPAGKW
jgi:hypothetical protein